MTQPAVYPLSQEQERTLDGVSYDAKNVYQERIQEILRGRGLDRYIAPNLVEAWMRQASPTLDGLSVEEFAREADTAIHTVIFDKDGLSERLAASMGL